MTAGEIVLLVAVGLTAVALYVRWALLNIEEARDEEERRAEDAYVRRLKRDDQRRKARLS